jgi:hypothetical protein
MTEAISWRFEKTEIAAFPLLSRLGPHARLGHGAQPGNDRVSYNTASKKRGPRISQSCVVRIYLDYSVKVFVQQYAYACKTYLHKKAQ